MRRATGPASEEPDFDRPPNPDDPIQELRETGQMDRPPSSILGKAYADDHE